MKIKLFISILFTFIYTTIKGQVLILATAVMIGTSSMPEHGFLPGKKFTYYPTINKFDFQGHKLRVELADDRPSLKLKKTKCSTVEFTNTSEFADSRCVYKVSKYIDTLFKQSNLVIDSSATDTVQIKLEGIDARLVGFGFIRVHGLCQIKIKYHDIYKTYCIDIMDVDKNSPIKSTAFVTRKTATRIMASASIREVLEQFLDDLKSLKR